MKIIYLKPVLNNMYTKYTLWKRCRYECRFPSAGLGGKRTVLVSASNDVYWNLALEDWLYRNADFSGGSLLLLWRNRPCVVIGRHQNPWVECNLAFVEDKHVALARRNSGGGAVYHDGGNLNCTFFTDRKGYDRRTNLQMIVDALRETWGFDLTVTKREDIFMGDKYKISGTAAKLGSTNAYHHCTLLFDVNKTMLERALSKNNDTMESKATASIRSRVCNLKDINAQVDFWPLVETISRAFTNSQTNEYWSSFQPNEDSCPGINQIHAHLSSWQWIYGHTPRFVIKRQFAIPRSIFIHNVLDVENKVLKESVREKSIIAARRQPQLYTIEVGMEVYRAIIEKFTLSPNSFLSGELLDVLTRVVVGHSFNDHLLQHTVGNLLKNCSIDIELFNRLKFISRCMCDLIKNS